MAEQTSAIENKTARIRELVDTLSAAGRAYYQESREIMSNFEYDRLYDELAELEKETGIVFAGSPTQNVGYEVMSSLPKERHEKPMLSLNKTCLLYTSIQNPRGMWDYAVAFVKGRFKKKEAHQ